MDFLPFRPFVPDKNLASRVLSPPYDVMSREEAKVLGKDELSFLRVTRSELELGHEVSAYANEVYLRAAENLRALIEKGVLTQLPEKVYTIYRQTRGAHSQIGVAGLASVRDYEAGRIKKHELTRNDKERDRSRHIQLTEAQTGLVFLAMKSERNFRDLLEGLSHRVPDEAAWLPSTGVLHELWFVNADSEEGEKIGLAMAESSAFYIADGHHRAASAMNVAKEQREKGKKEGPWEYFLSVVFPMEWLQILPYNRVVKDLNGLSKEAFLQAVKERFQVKEDVSPFPSAPHEISMYLAGKWYGLSYAVPKGASTSEALDVSVLQEELLAPILGIHQPREDERLDFVGGVKGIEALIQEAGQEGLAFSLYPTALEDLVAVSDAGLCMPPKSTWFEPKLADGLLVHRF